MKKKTEFMCLFLTVLMMTGFTACGTNDPEEPEQKVEETQKTEQIQDENSQKTSSEEEFTKTIETSLWELSYDEQDGWIYEEDDFYDEETFSKIILTIPEEGEDESVINAEIRVSVEDPYSFRDYLTSYGFDEYEYEVNQSYDLTEIGGIGCLREEGNYWGFPCLRYFNRVEGAGATIFIEIIGEYEDERVDKLLSGLTIHLEDIGNEDGPWYWEGEPFSAEPRSVMVGTYTLDSQWLPITDCIITKETFEHSVAVAGKQVFLLIDGTLQCYDYDGAVLKFAEDITLESDYEEISADTTGTIWLSGFMSPLIGWKDGSQTASYEAQDYVTMHPSGSWGISWFTSEECKKISLTGGAVALEPIIFPEIDIISRLLIDENHIYVCGSAKDESGHKVFVYDLDGNLQMTLEDGDGSSLGSVTFITETPNGYLALDGNMHEVVLWTKDGTYIGAADGSDLFGTSYSWFCDGTTLDDGSLLAIMTQTREDQSAQELVAYKLSGF